MGQFTREDVRIRRRLRSARTIAVIGASDKKMVGGRRARPGPGAACRRSA